ncbi:hypothetical protein JCM11641_003123 [Rhodosporidiobolus odoratus]
MPLPRALSFLSLPFASAPSSGEPVSSPSADSPAPASSQTDRNRKKRAQKKRACARRRSRAGTEEHQAEQVGEADEYLVVESTRAEHAGEEDSAPEADDDETYLERHLARTAQRAGPTTGPPPGDDERVELPSTPEARRQAVKAAAQRHLVEGKKKKSTAVREGYPARVKLPPGAGQVEGMPEIRSTPERAKKLEEAGFVPLVDDRGMLKVGLRVGDEAVLVHQPGATEPIVLRM